MQWSWLASVTLDLDMTILEATLLVVLGLEEIYFGTMLVFDVSLAFEHMDRHRSNLLTGPGPWWIWTTS